MGFPVEIDLDGQHLLVDLLWPAAKAAVTHRDGTLHHDLPAGSHVYLTPSGSSDFSAVPQRGRMHLDGASTYVLRANVVCEGGQAGLWLIEYDENGRLKHEARNLSTGPLVFSWTTHPRQRASILAVRLSGSGSLAIRDVAIEKIDTSASTRWSPPGDPEAPVSTGPRGTWGRWSQFFDPVGYRAYIERHHRFYDDRGAELYANALKSLAGRRYVLDVACGPGLLLRELLAAGAETAVGLERDPVYLKYCRSRGLMVHEHDLNHPFPFLASRAFDAVVVHQAIDCIAPMSMRTVLRESNRVLQDDGLLHMASRMDGQQAGDLCRSIRLNRGRLERILSEAGFGIVEFVADAKNYRLDARVVARRGAWEGRTVSLSTGQAVHPWKAPRRILDQEAHPWDAAGNRDFTLLTDERKSIVRQDGRLVAFYTGYHDGPTGLERAVCRAVSEDGNTWRRDPPEPVLAAGGPGRFDAGGVCCGSVLASADGPAPCVLYFSGRADDGTWPAIGIAFSDDGVHFTRRPEPILHREAFENIRHLALADVIRTSDGRWLLHAESWIDGMGWAISQACSTDGVHWSPRRRTPVLSPAGIPWGNRHVANPKVIELEPGRFVMGFNAAGPDLDFQIGLAESDDGESWRPLWSNPVIAPPPGEFRVESMFMTREAWARNDRRTYFFSAATRLEPGSHVVCATADPGATWVPETWETRGRARHRVRGGALEALPGDKDEASLRRAWRLDRETQACVRLAPESGGLGNIRLTVTGGIPAFTMTIRGDASIHLDREVAVASSEKGPASCCLRVVRPWSRGAEVQALAWQGDSLVVDQHRRLGYRPEELLVEIAVPPDQPVLPIDCVDIWQPDVLGLENNDARTLLGAHAGGEGRRAEIDGESFAERMETGDLERALVVPSEPDPLVDSYDRIAALLPRMLGRVYPCMRPLSFPAGTAEGRVFEVDQLERLWQEGILFGLEARPDPRRAPSREILAWAQERLALTLWRATSSSQLGWLRENVLEKHGCPVLLLPPDANPIDPGWIEGALALMDAFARLVLVLGRDVPGWALERAVQEHPDQLVLGSGFPFADQAPARARILRLDASDDRKAMVLSENLRFLLERTQTLRWQALHHGGRLRFPALPANPAELSRQGFVVVPVDQFGQDEPESARAYWSTLEAEPFYAQEKPWAGWIADVVREVRAESVLEFGCNRGRNLISIRDACPGARLVGLDINPRAIECGRADHDLDLRVGGEEALAAFRDDEFDFVFTVSVLDHIPDIRHALDELVRVCRRWLFLLEVRLPAEGKVLRHFDHRENQVKDSTTASYSWHIEKRLAGHPKVARLDTRPVYLHAASLGPAYARFLAIVRRP